MSSTLLHGDDIRLDHLKRRALSERSNELILDSPRCACHLLSSCDEEAATLLGAYPWSQAPTRTDTSIEEKGVRVASRGRNETWPSDLQKPPPSHTVARACERSDKCSRCASLRQSSIGIVRRKTMSVVQSTMYTVKVQASRTCMHASVYDNMWPYELWCLDQAGQNRSRGRYQSQSDRQHNRHSGKSHNPPCDGSNFPSLQVCSIGSLR